MVLVPAERGDRLKTSLGCADPLAMDPGTVFESIALRLYRYRWALAVGPLAAIGASLAGVSALPEDLPHTQDVLAVVFLVLSLGMLWSWGLALTAIWFHPEWGHFRIDGPRLSRARPAMKFLLRLYAAAALTVWFLSPFLVTACNR